MKNIHIFTLKHGFLNENVVMLQDTVIKDLQLSTFMLRKYIDKLVTIIYLL